MKTNHYILVPAITCLILSLTDGTNSSNYPENKRFDKKVRKITERRDSIPEVWTVSGNLKRIVMVRLKTRADLLEGIQNAIKKEKIKNGVILNGIGSVTSYHVHSVGNTTFPPVNVFAKENGPYDLLSVNGFIMNGRVHAHITLSDLKKTIGGHLDPGTNAFTFIIISIGVLDDEVNIENFDNWKWN